jgi:hypothetical protein
MTASQMPGFPVPLRDANGSVIAYFSLRITNELCREGEKVRELPDLDAFIRNFPFRSNVLHRPQGVIGTILVAPTNCSPLDEVAAAHIIDVWSSGEGILLLAANAAEHYAGRLQIIDLLQSALGKARLPRDA